MTMPQSWPSGVVHQDGERLSVLTSHGVHSELVVTQKVPEWEGRHFWVAAVHHVVTDPWDQNCTLGAENVLGFVVGCTYCCLEWADQPWARGACSGSPPDPTMPS